jgi:hypothetical protein
MGGATPPASRESFRKLPLIFVGIASLLSQEQGQGANATDRRAARYHLLKDGAWRQVGAAVP